MSEGNFEAKLSARRETKDGIFLTLLINPADHDEALAMVRVGARLMIGWAEVIDTEVHKIDVPTDAYVSSAAESGVKITTLKDRKRFEDLPLSQQAALRCQDAEFQSYLRSRTDEQFTEGGAAIYVRNFCGVDSRSELDSDRVAGASWRSLESQYQAHLTTLRHGESVR